MKLANDTEFGPISYVYTEDLKRGLRLSGQMQSGMVALNRGLASDRAGALRWQQGKRPRS
ncbi:acyl-CoA reductase-like NAD-dependent aldehyde dehydrogenase [Bradyrhizobium japonicum]|uniref:aldehyde dehydrogenase family protein n=1 Tax=Bradyrhizobium japonicum TaxID=375 RepID=UPI00339738D8